MAYMNLTVMRNYLDILKSHVSSSNFPTYFKKTIFQIRVLSILGEISVCSVAVSDVGSAYACKPCLDKVSKTRDKGKLTFFESETGFGNFRVRLDLGAVTGTGN